MTQSRYVRLRVSERGLKLASYVQSMAEYDPGKGILQTG